MTADSVFNSRTVPTRLCIGDAIISLLKEVDYARIKISDVIKNAAVSRMTFYRYYESVYDALCDYLQIIIAEYMVESDTLNNVDRFMELDHIEYSLNFFDRYKRYFMTMNANGLYSILIDAVNEFMVKYIYPNRNIDLFVLYSYAGGLLNSFLKWEEDGKKESAHNVAKMIYSLYNRAQAAA